MEKSVYTNKKFKEAVLELSKDCDSVEIYFDLQKYAGFLPTEFDGEYKGYYFTIHGREYGKWFEMIEPYDCDLKEFIEISRKEYISNDKRAKIKSEINRILDSNIKEVKQHILK